jgi:dihydropyrimidinase
MGIVLTGGTVVTAVECYRADVRIEEEQVVAVGQQIVQEGDTVVDAGGCLLFPGGIDPHTHFDLLVGETTTADDFYSGTRAAAIGGTTTILDFATQNKGESLSQALANWHEKAAGKSYIDYGFHLALSDVNAAILEEMAAVVKEAGVTSFKLYMAYKNVLQVDDGALLQVLRTAREIGALVCLHCENGDIIHSLIADARAQGCTAPKYHALTRPMLVEQEATTRAICLAELADAALYVVHVSCAPALRAIQEARIRGLDIHAETCPQYLLLDESRYNTKDFDAAKYVMSPPLRPLAQQVALWDGVCNGTVATVASDHCSFNLAGQKELGIHDFSKIPNGAPGVETRFGLLYTYGVATGKIDVNQFVELTSTRAAKLFGLFPHKGTIAVGSDADIVVWDPSVTTTISAAAQIQRVDYNPYEGFHQVGKAQHVFLRGRQIVKDGALCSDEPIGKYLARNPYPVRGGEHG